MKSVGGGAYIFSELFRSTPIFDSSGPKPYLMAVSRGECNFIQSSGARRKGKSSTGDGTDIK